MRRTFLIFAACALIGVGSRAQNSERPAEVAPPMPAEYAVRWNVAEGGPGSAEATLAALGLKKPEGSDDFEIRYFDLTAPSDAPAGFTSILRQRKKGKKKHELTFKYRGDHSLPSWTCPLSDTPDERKGEVDVSILPARCPKRAFSYSCTLESKDAPVPPPPALQAQPASCVSKMSRFKAGKPEVKVEEWHLPGGLVMVEVSRNGKDTSDDLDSFLKEVVDPLLQAGARPTDRSKTELGSACP